jgi:hypothetical protein
VDGDRPTVGACRSAQILAGTCLALSVGMTKPTLLAAALLATVLAPALAAAQPGLVPAAPPTVEASAEPATRWYGWQILAIDAAALGVAAASDGEGAELALTSLVLSGPLVHAFHGHGGRALGSLGLRLGAPIAGAYAMAAMCEAGGGGDDDWGCLGEIVLGFGVGAAVAEVYDVYRARDEVGPPRFTPSVRVADGGASVGIGGSF